MDGAECVVGSVSSALVLIGGVEVWRAWRLSASSMFDRSLCLGAVSRTDVSEPLDFHAKYSSSTRATAQVVAASWTRLHSNNTSTVHNIKTISL